MSQFIETIQLLHGKLRNLEFHQERFERTRREKLGIRNHPRLAEVICVPKGLDQGMLKCRVSYAEVIELIEYEAHQHRKTESLKLVYSEDIDYRYKYADRSKLESLYHQRGDCDDILVVKKGMVSDSFYANVILRNGSDWITPDTPLLPGTMRASLLNRGLISEESIALEDLSRYQGIKLINAMQDLHSAIELPMEAIHR
jgi:4-amino-4-deoxychorismate lyase